MVEKWIGFGADEEHRCKDSTKAYEVLRWPLIELGWNRADVVDYLESIGEPVPPPSSCVACFSRTVDDFREMACERPQDFTKARHVDETIRDMNWAGVTDPCFVSPTLKPLRQLEAEGFVEDDAASAACGEGYCFV